MDKVEWWNGSIEGCHDGGHGQMDKVARSTIHTMRGVEVGTGTFSLLGLS